MRPLRVGPRFALGLVLLGLTVAAPAADVINGFDLSALSVPREFVAHGGPPRDGIPALTDPKFIAAEQADFLRPEDRVLALTQQGIAKAYPIAILTWHELVNDRFGDTPVVVTYCPLCFTGMAFKASLAGRRHHFGVSGLLYNNAVLMYDKETESLWSQVMATSVGGAHKGKKLELLPVANTSWGDWRARHPKTLLLSRDTGHRRDYDRDPYEQYAVSPDIMFPIRFRAQGYHPKEPVLGLTLDGKAKAYPFVELRRSKMPLSDQLGSQPVVIRFDAEHDAAAAFDRHGRELPGTTAYWFAWYAFYPDTAIYKTQAQETGP